ncbi:MAG: hypothetical protein HS116_02205 [Planctomycetes bacterium]|nr:hypothetical protein [Planctomycetota bacterium]
MSHDPIQDALTQAESAAVQAGIKPATAGALLPYVRILDPHKEELVPFEAWPLTVELLDSFWPSNRRTIILKARQLGVSWAFALYALHHAGWTPHRTVGSVNKTKEDAAELIRRMRILWSTLPGHLRPAANWSNQHAEFANGSRVVCTATTDVAGAGLTFSLLGCDEAGLIPDLDALWPSLLPAVEKGQFHVFSTPRGDSGKFAELCMTSRGGNGPFAFRQLNWWERPDRDQETEQGRKWLADRKAELSARDFAREYECQFQRPGTAYFDDETIKGARANCAAPIDRLWGGRLAIFKRPQAGRAYVIGADVAEGLEDGDYSAACVLDKHSGEEVAAYHAHLGVTPYAEDLVRLAKLYNLAWLAVEANNHGHAVCAWAYQHLRYKRLLRESREAEGRIASENRFRLGVVTSVSSKPAMLAAFEHALRKGQIILRDAAAVEELSTFLCLAGGAYGAAPGQHDDRVMARVLAHHARGRRAPKTA